MRTKWYFGALIVLISFLGIYQNRTTEPNQEIVLQFADVNITADEAQSAIVKVKAHLQALGANAVTVQQLQAGEIKISYYSTVAAQNIKNLLANDTSLHLGYTKQATNTPSKQSKDYKFDVFELYKSNPADSGFGGKHVLNTKQDYDRFFKPNVYALIVILDLPKNTLFIEEAFKVFKSIAWSINKFTGSTHHVRAGPQTSGLV